MCNNCDGCQDEFNLAHAMRFKEKGLIGRRQNEIKDKLNEILPQTLIPFTFCKKKI